jgi:diguanylate cyclase (GGDEF)-like protein/PAS domain S-box-containing protein
MGAARHSEPGGDERVPAALFNRLPAIVWEADGHGDRMTYVSPRALDLLGHDPVTWRETPGFWDDHLHPDDRERVLAAVRRMLAGGAGTTRLRYRFRAADESYRWFADTIDMVAGGRLSGIMLDVTDDHPALDPAVAGADATADAVPPQRVSDAGMPTLDAIVDNISDGVYYVDRSRRIGFWNKGAERLTGYRADEVVGRHCFDNVLCHVDATGSSLCTSRCPLVATMQDGTSHEMVIWLKHADGSRRAVQTRTAPMRTTDGRIVGGVEIFSDATGLIEARDAAEAARRDALTDPLTDLPNRRLLDVVLASRQEDLDRSGRPYGFLIIDVDGFKGFNDQYGHDTGDEALCVVASTLRGGVRGGDALVRWGGDEFAIVAALDDEAAVRMLADRLQALMRTAHVPAAGEAVPIRISIGGALAIPGQGLADLFARADRALLAAKTAGRDRFVMSGPDLAA